MNILFKCLITLFLIANLYSCNNENDRNRDRLMRMLSTELNSASDLIKQKNTSVYKELYDKVEDPVTHEKAVVWSAKAQQIREISIQMINNLDASQTGKNTDWDTINSHFEKYIYSLKLVDTSFEHTFFKEFNLVKNYADSVKEMDELLNGHNGERIAVLSEMGCTIERLENILITYCNYQSAFCCGDWFDVDGVLIGQSTSHLRKGEVLTITTGVGAFSSKAKPEIIIDGKNAKISDAQGTSKIKINELPGKHYKTVKVNYTGKDTKPHSYKVNVEYTVDE